METVASLYKTLQLFICIFFNFTDFLSKKVATFFDKKIYIDVTLSRVFPALPNLLGFLKYFKNNEG